MAHQTIRVQQHLFRYQSFHIDKSQPLGHGSYGAVYKAKCDQLPCAAKVLHPTILNPTDQGAGKIMNRFEQECGFLESIRHPNIVQYLAMSMDPDSRLPMLLMELLDESLTKMLERSQHSLAYYVQVDICHDIALAVAYLHSNDIIHRDLSSNNVLIIAGRRAKVTDFGMSKLAGAAPSMTPLTMCPGTLAYMPPEALREPSVSYTKKLDCFSEGVIMIQVCTRLWPEPGSRTQLVPDSRSPTGTIEMPVLETERRKNHIDLIDPTHALLPIAMDCIKYQERERPSSEELCQRLAGLKDSSYYKEDVEQHNNDKIQPEDNQIISQRQQLLEKNRQLQDKDMYTQLQDKDRQLHDKDRQLQDKDRQLQDKDSQLQEKERQLQEKDRQLHDKERQLQDKVRQFQDKDSQLQDKDSEHQLEIASLERQFRQLNQQLEEQEQVTAEIQQTNHSLQRQVEQLQQQSSQQILKPAHKPHLLKERKLMLTWRDGGQTPFKMTRGAAVVDRNVIYFMNYDGELCSYNSRTERLTKLTKYPYEGSSLAVINHQLTGIGGCEGAFNKHMYTNKLLSLRERLFRESWSAIFPPMPTKRRGTTAITSNEHLIVAGGTTGPYSEDTLNTVEVIDTKTLVWSTVASLPHLYAWASSTICGDHLYILGGWDDKGISKSVLTCSLTELLQSSSSSSSVWHRVADAPAYRSTCAAVNGELLAVGGHKESVNSTSDSAVHKYYPTTNSWDLINNMTTARYQSLVAVLPTNEVITVGGLPAGCLCNIEIAAFTLH